MQTQHKGSVAALIANVIFGFSFLFSKIALDYAHPLIVLAVRFTVAFAVLTGLWAGKFVKMDLRGKPKKRLLLMALAQPLAYFIAELYGINYTSSAISGIIISLVPVAVIVLSTVWLHEKPTLLQIAFSALSLAAVVGVSVLSDEGGRTHLLGVLLLLVAVVCAAVFNILSRGESSRFSPVERTWVMFLVGTVGFNAIAVGALGGNFQAELIRAVSAPLFWVAIGYLSVASSIAAFMLYNYATTHISTVRAASFSNIITVVAVVAGIVFLEDPLSLPQLGCCALIILGVFGVNRK